MRNDFNRRFPRYPDDSDYNTNAPSYYEDLARKQKLIELLAKKIWEYEELLDVTLEELESRLQSYLDNWDERIENLDDEVSDIFVEWLNDGTLEQIINHDVLGQKADKSDVENKHQEVTAHLAQTVKVVNVKAFGAIGDGVVDDTESFKNAIATLNDGDTFHVPHGKYKTSELLIIDKDVHIDMVGTIKYYGQGLGLQINTPNGQNYSLDKKITIKIENKNFATRPDGVALYNILSSQIYLSVLNFNIGVKTIGYNTGFAYNEIHPSRVVGNKINLQKIADGLDGWVNQNIYIGGSMGWVSTQPVDDSYIHVEFICNSGLNLNQNAFYNVSLEATAVAPTGRAGLAVKLVPESQHNYFYNCRYENVKTIDGGNSNQNHFLKGHDLERVDFINKGRNVVQSKSKLEHITDSEVVTSFQSLFSSEAKIIQFINSIGDESGYIKGNADIKGGNLEVSSIKIGATSVLVGNKEPNENVTANTGSLYLYTLNNESKQIWVKSSGTETNTGWLPIQTAYASPTTYRPTNVQTGFSMFDLTVGKPIWWNGSNWVDATGTVVQ